MFPFIILLLSKFSLYKHFKITLFYDSKQSPRTPILNLTNFIDQPEPHLQSWTLSTKYLSVFANGAIKSTVASSSTAFASSVSNAWIKKRTGLMKMESASIATKTLPGATSISSITNNKPVCILVTSTSPCKTFKNFKNFKIKLPESIAIIWKKR